MCKIKMKANIYYVNICKHEHENNMTRLWSKIMLNRLKEMKGPTSIYTRLKTYFKEASKEVFICA